MKKSLWMYSVAAVIAIGGSVLTWIAGISYVPGILMLIGAIFVLGLGMSVEDLLLVRYDTPHDDDAHPPPRIAPLVVDELVVKDAGKPGRHRVDLAQLVHLWMQFE